MPDPDPQPPKPRAVSPARWLLMLLPSVIVLIPPYITCHTGHSHILKFKGVDYTDEITLAVSILACFFLGFRFEKWRFENNENRLRAIGRGFLILVINYFIIGLLVPA